MKNSYVLGYDLGNRTVASTAINDDFNILKNHGRLMTQINLFNEGQTKAARRGFRSARRSYNHKRWLRKQLINWFKINSDFDVELLVKYYHHSWVAKADLDHAKPDLKPLLIKNNAYPTVWHAADALINNRNLPKTYAQIQQLIFEVFYNLLGRRGHFLIPNLKVNQFIDKSLSYLDLGEQLKLVLKERLNLDLSFDSSKFNDILLSSASRGEKYDALCEFFGSDVSLAKPIAKFVFGYVVSAKELEVLFPSLPEFKKLNFNKTDIDDTLDELNKQLTSAEKFYASIYVHKLQEKYEQWQAAFANVRPIFNHEFQLLISQMPLSTFQTIIQELLPNAQNPFLIAKTCELVNQLELSMDIYLKDVFTEEKIRIASSALTAPNQQPFMKACEQILAQSLDNEDVALYEMLHEHMKQQLALTYPFTPPISAKDYIRLTVQLYQTGRISEKEDIATIEQFQLIQEKYIF